MDKFWRLLLVVLFHGFYPYSTRATVSTRPSIVNIGSVLSFNSYIYAKIGEVAKISIEAAIEDVNSNPAVLGGTKLKLFMHDTNYSGFLGIVEALKFMEGDTVEIIGPQSSVTAHVITHIANELQVPLLSFSATDPTLTSLQYPFFVMTSQNDLFQMTAIAEIVDHYEWRKVIAIYNDDDHGRNGIAALGGKLAERRCKISYKAPLNPEMSKEDITNVLLNLALGESRILVLHVPASSGLHVFEVADYLGMMGSGYFWIASSWLSTILDTNSPLPSEVHNKIQGVLTLRMHTPDSQLKRNFLSRWRNLTVGKTSNGQLGLNTYGLYAYDTVWLLAHAIDAFLSWRGNISFSTDSRLSAMSDGSLNLHSMRIFNGGNQLLQNVLQVNMTGVTGPIKFTSDRYLIHPAYEVLNVIGTGYWKIGYWSSYSGLSIMDPEALYLEKPNRSRSSQQLYDVIWPGQRTERPRGWVFPNNGRVLRIGVPKRVSYHEVISQIEGTDMFEGFCVDVFTSAINLVPCAVPYKLIPFGDGQNNPSATELVQLITTDEYDAAIGDIAIVTN